MSQTILIAEDDTVLRGLYVKKFQVAGYNAHAVDNGEDLITALKEKKPDLVITDVHMPKADGFHVLAAYPRAMRTFPIILLTNFDDAEFRTRAQELGADDYFVKKDMTIRKLLEMAERLLKKA